MKLFEKLKKSNSTSLVRVIAQGNTLGKKAFMVLYAPTADVATAEEFTKVLGPDYDEKILGGSWLYFDDQTKKVWNEAESIFK